MKGQSSTADTKSHFKTIESIRSGALDWKQRSALRKYFQNRLIINGDVLLERQNAQQELQIDRTKVLHTFGYGQTKNVISRRLT
jgi:hypothetical protein